jgi:hypothetical protein
MAEQFFNMTLGDKKQQEDSVKCYPVLFYDLL